MTDVIKINPLKKTELEFEVGIQGMDNDQSVIVRFVLIDANNCDCSFNCSRVTDTKQTWVVKLPVLSYINTDSCEFRVEVIIDDYYFEPAQGTLEFFAAKPEVTSSFTVKQDKSKPKVSTSFTVKEVDESNEAPIIEASGGGTVTTSLAPTNALLMPEVEPVLKSSAKISSHTVDDEQIDLEAVFGEITPGEGGSYPEPEDDRSAREIAADLIKGITGGITKPTSRGTLFKRDKDGNILDAGFESDTVLRKKRDNAEKVSKILRPQ